jgi:hypothetical protein
LSHTNKRENVFFFFVDKHFTFRLIHTLFIKFILAQEREPFFVTNQ